MSIMRRFAAVVAVAALVFAAADFSAAKDPAKKHKGAGISKLVADKLLAAYELLQNDKPDDAMKLVDQAAGARKLRPAEVAQIHRFRGYIYLDEGKSEKAAEEFQLARDQKALDAAAEQVMIYSLAQIYTQLGQYPRALELIDSWFQAEADPKPDAFYLKAMILAQQEKFEEALVPAKTAIDMSPTPRESWLQLLVAIYSNQKDYANVAATLQRLVEVAPANKKYWTQLSAVLNYLQRDPEALATLRLADVADLLSDDPDVRQLARLMFVRELPFQCAGAVEHALASGELKADADAYRLLSNCYLAARENDKAIEPLNKAAELAPDAEPYMLLGQIHLQQERFDPAIDALAKALAKAKPEQRAPIHLLSGVAQLGSERLDAAEREFHAAEGDAKTRAAATSYLKYVEQQRLKKDQDLHAALPAPRPLD
jgi:tetratricopeptide (TPR) repeat protein